MILNKGYNPTFGNAVWRKVIYLTLSRLTRKWRVSGTMLVRELSERDLKCKSVANLEESVIKVGRTIRMPYESSCSLKVPKGKQSAGALMVPVATGTACWG